MATNPFFDLPVKDIAWGNKTNLENDILGDRDDPNWVRYRRAHLVWDSKNQETKSGYKLIFARLDGGTLTAVRSQLSVAIAAINGARGGVDLSGPERRSAYNLAVRYLKKFDPDIEVPSFKNTRGAKLDKLCDDLRDATQTLREKFEMTKTMTPDEFLVYANDQLAKAGKEKKEEATARIDALQEATKLAKQSFTSSGTASIATFTDPKPTMEVNPQKAADDGTGQFASNLEELNAGLAKLAKGETITKVHGLDEDDFPDDMNDPDLIEKGSGGKKDGPIWGYDPKD